MAFAESFLESLTAEELRTLVRTVNNGEAEGVEHLKGLLTGGQVASIRRKEAVEFLLYGVVPASAGAAVPPAADEAAATIDALRRLLGASVSESQVRAIVEEVVESRVPRRVEVVLRDGTKSIECKGKHRFFPLVYACVRSGCNVLLTGPAGNGKTTLAIDTAKALGRDYLLQAWNIGSTKADVLGFVDANGNYHASLLRKAMVEGLVLICDEFDSCHPGVGTILNAAFANRELTFPDGVHVKAHNDFQVIACANTWGLGATEQYVGRNRLDAATLDRFVAVRVPLDADLEAQIVGVSGRRSVAFDLTDGGICSADEWLGIVERVRECAERHAWRHVISPRATIHGVKLFEQGIGRKWVLDACLLKGMSDGERCEALSAAGL